MTDQSAAPSKVRTLPVLATVVVVAATVLMLLALPVLAAPVPTPAASSGASPAVTPASNPAVQQWAYGATKTITGDVSVTGSNGNGFELSYHAFFGWTVVFTQTNNSTNSGLQIEAQRTASAELYVNLCTPNCTSPTWTGNYTASAVESATAFGNFTRDGTVYVDNVATSALGFLNGSAATQDALHSKLTVTGALGNSKAWYFNVTASANAQVYFDPELGLIPYSLTSGEHWNSTSTFNVSGAYALSWTFVGPNTQSSGSPSGSFGPTTGTIDLVGAYSQDLSLKNGERTQVLLLGISGPGQFGLFDGVIILPHDGDVFSGDPAALGGQGLGVAPVAATSAVDYSSGGGHLGIDAAATTFAPGTSGSIPSSALVPMATSTSGGDVQAQPMSVAAAQSCAASLAKGGDCLAPGTFWTKQIGPFHTTGLELVALAVGVVALVAVLGVAVGRRPKAPPPVRVPNSSARVPAGASGQVAPPPRTPPQQPSDPLGNLW
jgi:hypothetical protein